MPYRLKENDAAVQDALRRIADEQIGRALAEIADDDLPFGEKVHQVRKRCKKLRGLLRLVRKSFDGYADENAAFRDAARHLSPVRDADTLITTYDDLMAWAGKGTDRRAFGPIRARLTRQAKAVRADADTAVRMESARRALDGARARAAGWTLDAGGFDAVAGGLRRTYKRASTRMEAAWAEPTDAALHEWRKRVKYHWYHARLLARIDPRMMPPHEAAMSELADLLGDHHDLAVLGEWLDEADLGPGTDAEGFRALLDRRKEALARRAFEQGRLILAERGEPLVARWESYWTRWRAGEAGAAGLLVEA
jgi:CHAD domain-containing protein